MNYASDVYAKDRKVEIRTLSDKEEFSDEMLQQMGYVACRYGTEYRSTKQNFVAQSKILKDIIALTNLSQALGEIAEKF